MHIISCVIKHSRQIFKDFNILPVDGSVLKIIWYIKNYKESLKENVQIHNYNVQERKWISMVNSVIQIFLEKCSVCRNLTV
jgi:hypothetical protein